MASFALLVFPLFALGLFTALGPARGFIWTVGIGFLFLPDGYSLNAPIAIIPPYNKMPAIALGVLLGYLLTENRNTPPPIRDPFVEKILLGLFGLVIVSELGTWLTNTSPIARGNGIFNAGVTARDTFRDIYMIVVDALIIWLAWRILRRREDMVHLLQAITILGLAYIPLVFFELIMSPQLSNIVYNHFPHSWIQHVRAGGYKPLVFLSHGLTLGIFLAMATLAACVLSRADPARKAIWLMAGGALLVTLLMSRNAGASVLTIALAPLILFSASMLQTRIAMMLAALLLVYPVLVKTGLSPSRQVLKVAEAYAPARAHSLKWRLDNEELFLNRHAAQPLFGWGGRGRARLYNKFGRDISTADGLWIIQLVQHGWAGYFALIGFWAAPVLLLRRHARKQGSADAAAAGMGLMMGANFIYLIPNATMGPFAYMILGTIAAHVATANTDDQTSETREPETRGADPRQPKPRTTSYAGGSKAVYSRFRGAERPKSRPPTRTTYSRTHD